VEVAVSIETPESIKKHESEYLPDAWMKYSVEELGWWVKLLTKRAEMRADPVKKAKDLEDAANYEKMRVALIRELGSGHY
jgi:hypothetical protein